MFEFCQETSKPARTTLPPPSLPTKPDHDAREVEEEEDDDDEEEDEETKTKDTSEKDKVENTKVEEAMDITKVNKDTKIDKSTQEEKKSDTKPLPSSIQARIQRLLGPAKTMDTSSEKTKPESPAKKLPDSNPSTSDSKTKIADEEKQEAMEVDEEEGRMILYSLSYISSQKVYFYIIIVYIGFF